MELCNYPRVQKVRFYEIEAIQLPIVYNKYGDHDPNGLMYVLKKDGKRVREKALAAFSRVPPQPCEEVQPLVIRANVGGCCENFFYPFSEAPPVHSCAGAEI